MVTSNCPGARPGQNQYILFGGTRGGQSGTVPAKGVTLVTLLMVLLHCSDCFLTSSKAKLENLDRKCQPINSKIPEVLSAKMKI